jgi:hypothetical protein
MSSSNKIHPIYVALDANQYNRAIKLCLALPKENILAQALLAHAYNKSMQRYKAILVMQSILGTDGFQELQLECQYCKEAWDQQKAAFNTAAAPQALAGPKKGKKGKKKPALQPGAATKTDVALEEQKWSLADHLEATPAIDENWEKLPPTEKAITDEVSWQGTFVSVFRQCCVVFSYFLTNAATSDRSQYAGDNSSKSTSLLDKLSTILLGCFTRPS